MARLDRRGWGGLFVVLIAGRLEIVLDHDPGPYMRLVGASVRLARRDLGHPFLSVGARAYLRGEPYQLRQPGIDLRLFAELIGFRGSWET